MTEAPGNVRLGPGTGRPGEPYGQPGGNGGGGGRDHEFHARLSVVETLMKNVATKTDIEKIKTWVLAGVIAGIIAAAGIAAAVAAAIAALIRIFVG